MAQDDGGAASLRMDALNIHSAPSDATQTPLLSHTVAGLEQDDPPPYSAQDPNSIRVYASQDTRVSSSQSLVSPEGSYNTSGLRRKLLIVFIHGFMGDETSFQSFPAHVHNVLSVLLADTHTVHTKIYPRYRSKKAIQVATNDFSTWLQPHEAPDTDVILAGHSMGGLLAAEVALIPSVSPKYPSPFKHRILGTISLDTPFLGMHPGVIKSGLSSLFRPEPSPPRSPQSGPVTPSGGGSPAPSLLQSGGTSLGEQQDQNYNPTFPNDVHLPVRTGWANAQHFVRKHIKHLASATQQLITSHVEFGSCLADLEGLKARYCKIRMLEDAESDRRATIIHDRRAPPRIRFVNYYTASTGRLKRPSVPAPTAPEHPASEHPAPTRTLEFPNEKRQQSVSESVLSDQTAARGLDEEDLSDPESVLTELSDLSSFNDARSEFSDATTIAPLSEIANPDIIVYDPDRDPPPPVLPEYQSQVVATTSSSLTGPPPLPSHFNTVPAFKNAMKEHHDTVKKTVIAFREQQKAEFNRFKTQAMTLNKASKEELKTFLDAQKAERKQFYETAKHEWKSAYGLVKEEVEARKKNIKALADTKRSAEKQERAKRREEAKAERLNKKCERNEGKGKGRGQGKGNGKGKKRAGAGSITDETVLGDAHSLSTDAPAYDVSTAAIGDTINGDRADSTASSSSTYGGPSRTNTMTSSSSEWTTSTTAQSTQSAPTAPFSPPPHVQRTTSGYAGSDSGIPRADSWRGSQPLIVPPTPKIKDRKFCILPPKDASGTRDPTWVRVFMKGMDEVGAHCGLFVPVGPMEELRMGEAWSERYAKLVQHVAERIEEWVAEWMSEPGGAW